jgi:deoxycytidylate deaminase
MAQKIEKGYTSPDNPYMKIAKNIAEKSRCKKMQTGTAIVITNKQNGHEVIVTGNNDIGVSWKELKQKGYDDCPRRNLPTGVGYELCRDICKQKYHSEVSAIENGINLGILPLNDEDYVAEMYMYGHWYCCSNCLNRAEKAGIRKYYVLTEEHYKEEIKKWGINLKKD